MIKKSVESATKQGRLCDINVLEYKFEDLLYILSNFYQLQQIPILKSLDESQLKYLTVPVENIKLQVLSQVCLIDEAKFLILKRRILVESF